MRLEKRHTSAGWSVRRCASQILLGGALLFTQSCDNKPETAGGKSGGGGTEPPVKHVPDPPPPKVSGQELIDRIREETPSIPIDQLAAYFKDAADEVPLDDPETIEDFLLELPLGDSGMVAFRNLVGRMQWEPANTEMIESLIRLAPRLDPLMVYESIGRLVNSYARNNPELILNFLKDSKELPYFLGEGGEGRATKFLEGAMESITSGSSDLDQRFDMFLADPEYEALIPKSMAVKQIAYWRTESHLPLIERLLTHDNFSTDEQKSIALSYARELGVGEEAESLVLAVTKMDAVPEEIRASAVVAYAANLLEKDVNRGLEWLGSLPTGHMRDRAVYESLSSIKSWDPEAAEAWKESISDPEIRAKFE